MVFVWTGLVGPSARCSAARLDAPRFPRHRFQISLTEIVETAAPLSRIELDPTAMLEEALAAEKPPSAAEDTLGELGDPTRPLISSFDIDPKTVSILAEKGIINFTPIQAQSYNLLKGCLLYTSPSPRD